MRKGGDTMEQVLLVEDEPRLRDIVRDYFAAHGLGCDLARDGEEALDLLLDHDYDAILLDILMPNLDGFGVCRAVREKIAVPILFLTALGGHLSEYPQPPMHLRRAGDKTLPPGV